MSRTYEHDYADHTVAPFFEHGDEPPCNFSDNPNFYEVMDAHIQRRSFVLGGLASIVTGIFGAALPSRDALAKGQTGSSTKARLGFDAVPLGFEDTVVVPKGYRFQVLGAWGEPITGHLPAYNTSNTGDEQSLQIGQHHDGMHFFPLDGSSDDGLLVVNHEYVEPRFLHAEKYKGLEMDKNAALYGGDGKRDDDEVRKEMNAHGLSIYRVSKQSDGQWVIQKDKHNRRITGFTPMELSGPVRGADLVRTKYSLDGTKTRGTVNNCAHGVTPWGTYMAAEENWAGYFTNTDTVDLKPHLPREHDRYGVSSTPMGNRYGWHLARSGGDDFVRFDASTKGVSAVEDYRNEPNTFGYMVEIDPFDPNVTPVKRTHLGRFAHEGVVFAQAQAGKPVVCYSGDDARFEYIYKFVSKDVFVPGQTDGSILDAGTLYVARFNDDGTGEWIALEPDRNGLTPTNGFHDLADILINTRLAADKVGATKMDRPEWGTVDPNSGEVYFTLTNNTRRTEGQVDAVNPRATNNFGQIVRWRYAKGDNTIEKFDWDLFVIAGPTGQSATMNGEWLTDHNTFACPDGIWCDADSRLWIQTDMGDVGPDDGGPLADFGMNGMLAADPRSGEIRRFLTGPWGQECTGVVTTPDKKTMFVNFQHPGAHASAKDFAAGNMGSTWPDNDPTLPPRSATIVITRDDGGVIGA